MYRVWNLKTNTSSQLTLVGHEGTVRSLQFDKEKVVSGANDCTIRIWNINTGELIATLEGFYFFFLISSFISSLF